VNDEELVRWFLAPAVPDWPSQSFRLLPWVEVADPDAWRRRLLFRWATGDEVARQAVVEELRLLREMLSPPAEVGSNTA
jgi:hypothetical protein